MPRVQPHIWGQNVVYLSAVRAGILRLHHIISLTLLHCGGYEGCHHHCPLSFGGGGNGGGGGVNAKYIAEAMKDAFATAPKASAKEEKEVMEGRRRWW